MTRDYTLFVKDILDAIKAVEKLPEIKPTVERMLRELRAEKKASEQPPAKG